MVDDEEDVRLLFELYLRGRGHAATVVDSAAAARRVLTDATFDVVFIDVALPDAEGTGVVEQLRAEGLLPPRVVLVSGLPRTVVEELAADLGVVPLCKPFAVDELDAVLGVGDGD